MNNRRVLLVELLHDLIMFFTIHTIITIPGFYYLGMDWIRAMPFCLFLFLISSMGRLKVKHFVVFAIIHGAMFIPMFVFDNLFWKIFYFIFVFFTIIYSFGGRINGAPKNNGLSLIVPLMFICFTGLIFNEIVEINIPPIFFFLVSSAAVVSYAAMTHVKNIDTALDNMSEIGIQPVQSILRFNNIIIVCFCLLIAVFALLSQVLPIGDIITMLLAGILAVIRFIVGLFGSPAEEYPEFQPTGEVNSGKMNFDAMDPGEPNIIWIILEKILLTVIPIAVILLLIFLILYTAYTVYKKFNASGTIGVDTKEFAPPLYSAQKEKRMKRKIPFFPRSEEEKIRREFYRKVKGYISKGVDIKSEDTPRSISKKIAPYEDIRELTERYEKARYL